MIFFFVFLLITLLSTDGISTTRFLPLILTSANLFVSGNKDVLPLPLMPARIFTSLLATK